MKKMIKYFLIGLAAMVVFTYLLGLSDDAFHRTGVWYKDIVGSIKYYVLWVLPYWWLIILAGTIVIGLLSYGIKIGITKLRS
jgi:hypothetical protein